MRSTIFILFFFTLLGCYAQTNAITIRFIGNCGLSLTDGATNIYIDFPYKSGAHHYSEYNLSELDSVKQKPIFIYTHKHSDHFSGKLVRRLKKQLEGQLFTPKNADELKQLSQEIPDFSIETFKTSHQFSFNHYSYLITWHGKKFFFSGDTENAETIASLSNLDIAFIPVWLIIDANEKGIKIQPLTNLIAVYHIGPRDKITFSEPNPKLKLLNQQGEVLSIEY